MVTASQSSTSADAASARSPAKRYARNSRLIALLGSVTAGIGLLLTGISVAQQSPEIVEAIGDAYQIGRMRVNGGMVVQTILYNGRPIATGVMLPTRAEVASTTGATTLGAAGALEIAGTVLSGEVSGKYFILHRTRGNRSTIHGFFLTVSRSDRSPKTLRQPWQGSRRAPGTKAGTARTCRRSGAAARSPLNPWSMPWSCTLCNLMERRFAPHHAMAGAWSRSSNAERSRPLSPSSPGMRTLLFRDVQTGSSPGMRTPFLQGVQTPLFQAMSTAWSPEMRSPSIPGITTSRKKMRPATMPLPGRKIRRRDRLRVGRIHRLFMTTIQPRFLR